MNGSSRLAVLAGAAIVVVLVVGGLVSLARLARAFGRRQRAPIRCLCFAWPDHRANGRSDAIAE